MAISDSQKLDFLWKKLGYGFSKTETNSNKLAVNESISSPLLLRGDNIWTQSGSIPTIQPGSSSSLVTVYPTSTPLECTNDGSASPNRTWLTGATDWISPEFGATFIIKVYIHTSGDAANAASSGTQVLAAGSGNNDEWFFDYQSGVLNFNGTNLPNGVNFSGKSVYIAGARYNGNIGFNNLEINNLNVSGISTFGDELHVEYQKEIYFANNSVYNAFQISQNGSTQSLLKNNVSGGNILIATGNAGSGYVQITNASGSETAAKFTPGGATELHHDGNKKLETTSGGVNVTGGVNATGVVGIGTDSNLTANLTIGNIEETSTTNKGALAIKTLANSNTDIGHSAIYIEEPTSGYGFYTKVSNVYSTTAYQIGSDYSFSYGAPFTISDSGDVGIKTNYTDTFCLKLLSEDENVIKIENTHNGLTGSDIRIFQDSNSPAANDKLLTLDIRGNSSAGTESIYSKVIASIEDPTDGSEDGKFTIQTSINETLTDRIVIDSGGVGIGTTNAVNAALHVAGRNLSLGGPGYNNSGESNLWLGDYNNPANNTYDPNIRVGTRNQFQFEIESDYGNGTRSNNLFYVDPNSVGFNVYGDSNSPGTIFYYNYSRTAADQYLFFSANSKYLWFDGDTGRLGVNRSSGSGWSDTLDVNGSAKVNGNLTVDAGTNSTITVKCDDTGAARIKLHGDSQGTGFVEVGQSSTYGGGMSYNGDNSPAFASGETADRITFYRMDNGTRSEVFSYPYNSDTVTFNGTVSADIFSGDGTNLTNVNATTLDTIDSTSFLRSDAADQKTSGTLRFNDNVILSLGSGDDAEFFVNGSHMYLDLNSGIGNFYIRDGTTTRYTFDDNGSFTATGNVTAYSDIKLKENIELIANPLDKVLSLRGVTYNRIDIEDEPRHSGVIAQEVEEVLPEVVNTNEEGIKSVAYGNMVGLLIEAIKEQQQQIDELKRKLEEK